MNAKRFVMGFAALSGRSFYICVARLDHVETPDPEAGVRQQD